LEEKSKMNNLLNRFTTASCTLVFGIFASLSMLSTATLASTPDGETPANEGVCDVLIGATPGLYGLCNAYCEAQDLDSFDKEPPRSKILANYDKKKQAGDPDMPCLQVPCPCWSADELGSIHADGQAVCLPETDKLQIVNTTVDIARQFAEADTEAGRERCRYLDLNTSPRTIRFFSITADEAQSCFSQVEQACSGL
jgi:hypothetical protein